MSWTFTTLKSAIQDYTQNTESTFVSNLPTLIVQAENRIVKSVELPNFRKNVTGTLTSTNPYLSAPTDYLYPFSLAVLDSDSNYSYLLNKDVSFIREAYPFMKGEPDILAGYENRFKEALGKLTLESDGYNRKDAFRDGQRKVDV